MLLFLNYHHHHQCHYCCSAADAFLYTLFELLIIINNTAIATSTTTTVLILIITLRRSSFLSTNFPFSLVLHRITNSHTHTILIDYTLYSIMLNIITRIHIFLSFFLSRTSAHFPLNWAFFFAFFSRRR